MLYQIRNASVSLGGRPVLKRVCFDIRGTERIAVVGENGSGKTTLLKLIAGELLPDADDKVPAQILSARKLTKGMLRQIADPESLNLTVDELLMRAFTGRNGAQKEEEIRQSALSAVTVLPEGNEDYIAFRTDYDRLFTGFGFSAGDKGKRLSEFSGGEQTKISLIRLLLEKPDILLLDEPTNHLDLAASEWLEEYLRSYRKAVVMVSHDRFFLDRTAEVTWELEGGVLTRYTGGYSAFREQKQKRMQAWQKAWDEQQEEKKRLEELIERFKQKPRKAAFARSRRQMLSRMEPVERPPQGAVLKKLPPVIPAVLGSRHVFETEHTVFGYDRGLYELSFRMARGRKTAVIGDNGTGKSTLLKTVYAALTGQPGPRPVSGKVRGGTQITVGYFDQHTAERMSGFSLLEYVSGQFPAMTEKDVRSFLGGWLFSGKDAAKPVSGLSGGEKARLALAVILKQRPNFLILDEPTNHCDLRTMERLEEVLCDYAGTILFASHDRYFVSRTADSLLLIENGEVFYYPFGYAHYLEQREKQSRPTAQMSAENQALVEKLRAVPRGSMLQGRPLTDREAEREWRLKPFLEAMEQAESAAGACFLKLQKEREQYFASEEFWNEIAGIGETGSEETDRSADRVIRSQTDCEGTDIRENTLVSSEVSFRQALDAWTESCLAWYDEWNH